MMDRSEVLASNFASLIDKRIGEGYVPTEEEAFAVVLLFRWVRDVIELGALNAYPIQIDQALKETLGAMRKDGQGLSQDQEQTIRRGLGLS